MEVIQFFDRPVPQVFYSVAGRFVFVESFDVKLRSLIEELFAGWQLTPTTFPDRSPDILINFRRDETAPGIPGNLNCFEIADGGRCYTDGADFYIALGNSLLQLVNGKPVTVNVWLSELRGLKDPLLTRVASFAVCAALRRYGLFDLHSAGVVEPQSGKAVLIVGPSGSGKSTLALQLARSGWSYLSDDELLLSVVDGAVEARGFRSFFAVRQGETPFKHCFEPETVLGSRRSEQALPGCLLFITLSGESTSQLKALTQAATMARLIRACPWATYDTSIATANLEVLSALARQAIGFDLFAGRDLLEPGVAAALLSHR